jgi:NAD(P)H-hydrate epimerase
MTTAVLTREQARLLDQRAMTAFGVPGIVLMENAGRGMAELLVAMAVRGPVVVCCGKGNNGGDGLVIARHLDLAAIPVHILLFADPAELAGDAAINHGICVKAGLFVEVFRLDGFDEGRLQTALTSAEWIVDALFGSGLQGAVRAPWDRMIATINASPARRFAVDLPSGMDADTGEPLGACVRADHTATVVAMKAGFAQPVAQPWLGQVHVIGMGAPRKLLDEIFR